MSENDKAEDETTVTRESVHALAGQVAEMMADRKALTGAVPRGVAARFATAMQERGFKAEVVTGIVGSQETGSLKLEAKTCVRVEKRRVRKPTKETP
jgi:hypothetical protein